jgi:hypothetical protein
MRGCTACAQQAIGRYKDTDEGLVKLYNKAINEVRLYLEDGTQIEL